MFSFISFTLTASVFIGDDFFCVLLLWVLSIFLPIVAQTARAIRTDYVLVIYFRQGANVIASIYLFLS